jgi:hypothetical protein
MNPFDFFRDRFINPKNPTVRTPNEHQYDDAAALSLIAYKNQDPNQRSDLDTAKLNFENNYQKFLMLFGQYSNSPLKHYPYNNSSDVLSYPITNKTKVFDNYPMKKPFM